MSAFKSKSLRVSFRHAFRGVWLAVRSEKSLRWQGLALLLVLLAGLYLQFTANEFALVIIASALVLAMEFMNSALEYLADVVHPSFSKGIGHAKDIAAGAVLVSSVAALLTAACLILLRFW